MEKKKLYLCMSAILLTGMIVTGMFGMYLMKEKNTWMYRMTDNLLSGVAEQYPGAEEKAVHEILSKGVKETEHSVLQKYGVEEEAFIQRFDDSGVHMGLLAGMAAIMLAVCVTEGLLVFCYSKSQNRKLEEMEQYCEAILNGRYEMDLRNNEEGDFSILKNKVYDITVMLNEKNRRLEQNKKETEQLLADISHQLKTPVTSLNMINELLYLDLPEEKKIEFLDNMQKDLMRIEWFVKAILNLAKLDSKTLVLKRENENAVKLSREVAEYFRTFCEMHACSIQIACEEDQQVLCDKKWTKEAINNIVKNAIEHGAKTVQMMWEDNYLYTKLEISDDGEGIEKEELPHIFERFYKTKNCREDSVGLGLAFCKSIMEHQNGEIKVRSKKGDGTVFTFKFYKNM